MTQSLHASNLALAGRYDEIAYDALPHRATHPARLAAAAALSGHAAPSPQRCSVLEVGCSDGSNLIAMAVSLPGASFVGCDLSSRAIQQGRRTIDALGLTNVTLVEGDLAALAPEHARFDYIVAHGVYSWVPAAVRDAMLALGAQRLSHDGVLYVSYNVLPGCRVRQAAWDVLHHHVDHIPDARARLEAARHLARLLADGGTTTVDADQAVRAEFRAIAQRSDSELCHDDLAVPNEPVLFHTFAEHAAQHGLHYLAEATFPALSNLAAQTDAQAYAATLDRLAREQYLDFISLRRFRQSMLVHAPRRQPGSDAAPPGSAMAVPCLRDLHVSATWELARAAAGGGMHKLARRFDPAGGGGGPVRKLLEALVAAQPGAVPIATLAGRDGLPARVEPIESVLLQAYEAGVVDLHVLPPPLTITASQQPMASPLARLQARTQDAVTTLLHTTVSLADKQALKLLPLVDGTRDRAALASALRSAGINLASSDASAFVDYALTKFAQLGLLMPDAGAS